MKLKGRQIALLIVCLLLACALLLGLLFSGGCIGVSAGRLEENLRASQRIDASWTTTGSVSDDMAAFLSYPADQSDHTFSLYVNRPGFSFGYFFRAGGSLSGVEQYILEYTIEGCSERAFFSMNAQNAVRLEVDDGQNGQVIALEPGQPFAIVLPADVGSVTFYDADDNPVAVMKQSM